IYRRKQAGAGPPIGNIRHDTDDLSRDIFLGCGPPDHYPPSQRVTRTTEELCGGLIDNNHRQRILNIARIETASRADRNAQGLEVTRTDPSHLEVMSFFRWVRLNRKNEIGAPLQRNTGCCGE